MLGRYLLALLLTIAIEVCVVYLVGFREKQHALAVVMINLITHPILNYLIFVLDQLGADISLIVIGILEIVIVVAEWLLLVHIFCTPKGRFFVASFLANAGSFFAGILLFWR